MRLVVALACAALLAGCSSSRVEINAGTTFPGGTMPPGGSSVTTGSAGLHVRSSGSVAAAILAISLIAAAVEYNREDHPMPHPRVLIPGNTEPVPALAPERPVSEQDCSKPLTDFTRNLKCR